MDEGGNEKEGKLGVYVQGKMALVNELARGGLSYGMALVRWVFNFSPAGTGRAGNVEAGILANALQ